MKRIILTGGGTAGHVTPNIALLPKLRELDYDIHYIGSYEGIEKKLVQDHIMVLHPESFVATLIRKTFLIHSAYCKAITRHANFSKN